MAKHIVKEKGILGLYVGIRVTIFRETFCYAAQFGTFDSCKHVAGKIIHRKDEAHLPFMLNFISGGLSGLACWLASYP
jgi:hypothetical protein